MYQDWSANSSKQPKSKQALQGALNFPSKPPCLPDTTRFTDSCPSQIIQEGMNAEVPCVQYREELGLLTREIPKSLRSKQEWKSPSKRNFSIKIEPGLGGWIYLTSINLCFTQNHTLITLRSRLEQLRKSLK